MKITLHVPIEQFGFVGAEMETIDNKIQGGDADAIRENYDAIATAFKPQPINTLPEKDWRNFLEKLLLGEPNHIDMYEQCSPEQKKTVNEIKKTLKRLEAKSPENNHE